MRDREGLAAFFLRARSRGMVNNELFSVIEKTPRHLFVPSQFHSACFSPRMIPIECGETIEGLDLQADLINALDLQEENRVFEIGTGSGFTGALMAQMASRVTTVDRFATLKRHAVKRFKMLGLNNVIARQGDGEHAVEGEGPFDRIIVWAAFETLPRHFTDLLSAGGIMIAAIGNEDEEQVVTKLTKVGSRFERVDLTTVRFQPLQNGVAAAL